MPGDGRGQAHCLVLMASVLVGGGYYAVGFRGGIFGPSLQDSV